MKERTPYLLKTYRPFCYMCGQVVLSDGMRNVILHVTQIPAFQSKQVPAECERLQQCEVVFIASSTLIIILFGFQKI